ncbi:MAG: hypothetical protein M3M97_04555 [Actinomycetota bacterium]|nr:hypothetical protein [Actinomycetota bacterium]
MGADTLFNWDHFRPNQVKNANAYAENGITHLMLGFIGPDYDLAPLEGLVAWHDSRNGS